MKENKKFTDVSRYVVTKEISQILLQTLGVYHLPRDSGNSGWVVDGTWFFGLFHWKISGKSGTSEKVVLFSRWKFSDGTACTIYGLRKGFPVPGRSRPYLRQGNMAATLSASSVASVSSAFYECSVCHGLAPDLELRNSSCGLYFSAQSFKGPSSHPEVAFKFMDRKRICKQTVGHVTCFSRTHWLIIGNA